jgi:hypothetical protein
VAAAWPALTIAAHDQFATRFDEYACSTTPPAFGDGFTDGLAFARTLPLDILTEEALIELLFARTHVTDRGETLRPRHGIGDQQRQAGAPRSGCGDAIAGENPRACRQPRL